MAARSVWKGYISFGLVSVPIRLFAAARYSHIAFHQIHRSCGTRIRQQLYCPHDDRVVARDELALGYEVSKDEFVLVEPQELKKVQPPSSTVMEILQFVELGDVDPIYFETSYSAVPDQAGQRAYSLLFRTMDNLQYGAVAKITMHQRERTVILRPYGNGLTLHTLYYPAEIREATGYGKHAVKELRQEELTLAQHFARGLLKPFHPELFHDTYQERVRALIESKSKGQAGPRPQPTRKLAPVIDLMAALKKSLAEKPSSRESKSPHRKLRKTA
jgi:DNA end-binding protein Ku